MVLPVRRALAWSREPEWIRARRVTPGPWAVQAPEQAALEPVVQVPVAPVRVLAEPALAAPVLAVPVRAAVRLSKPLSHDLLSNEAGAVTDGARARAARNIAT
jgi:hypothetical protein